MMPPSRFARGPSLLPLLVLVPGFVAIVVATYRTFVPDDLFIYLQFARNLTASGLPAFNPGEPTYGFTSAIWLGLLAAGGALSGRPEAAARVLSVAASVAALAGMAVLAFRLSRSRTVAWTAVALLSIDAWFLRWSATGMETSLAVALALWGFARNHREIEEGLGSVGSLLVFAALALVRPEAVLLVALAVAAAVLPAPGRAGTGMRWGVAARSAAAAAALLGPWWGYAAWRFGTILPDTGPAKGVPGAALERALASLTRTVGLGGLTVGVPFLLLVVAAVVRLRAAGGGGIRPLARDLAPHRLLVAWLVALPVLYAAAGVKVYSRYLLIGTPLLLAAGLAAGWGALGRSPRGRGAWTAAVVATALSSLVLTHGWVAPASRAYARSLQTVNVELGRWLAANTRAGAVVAAENIGAIAYYSGRRILDMNGLISPQMIPYKRRGRVEEYLAAHPPDYLIKIHPQRDPWSGGVIGLDLEPIQVLAYEHMFINQKDPLYYTLYRVLGSVEERARPGRASSAADMVR